MQIKAWRHPRWKLNMSVVLVCWLIKVLPGSSSRVRANTARRGLSAVAHTPLLLWTAVCLACWTAGPENGRGTPTCNTYTFPWCKYAQSGQFQLAIVRRLMKTLWNCQLALFGSQQMKPSLDSPPFRSVPWEGNADDNMGRLVQKFP